VYSTSQSSFSTRHLPCLTAVKSIKKRLNTRDDIRHPFLVPGNTSRLYGKIAPGMISSARLQALTAKWSSRSTFRHSTRPFPVFRRFMLKDVCRCVLPLVLFLMFFRRYSTSIAIIYEPLRSDIHERTA